MIASRSFATFSRMPLARGFLIFSVIVKSFIAAISSPVPVVREWVVIVGLGRLPLLGLGLLAGRDAGLALGRGLVIHHVTPVVADHEVSQRIHRVVVLVDGLLGIGLGPLLRVAVLAGLVDEGAAIS